MMIADELRLVASICGIPSSSISANEIDGICTKRKLAIPIALKDYYLTFGLNGPKPSTRYEFMPLSRLSEAGDLVFARFANLTKENGILGKDRGKLDPEVYERDIGTAKWYDGGRSLASCLINCSAWEGMHMLSHRQVLKYTQRLMQLIEDQCQYIGGKQPNYGFIYFRSLVWGTKPLLVCTYMSAQIVIASMDKALVNELIELVAV